MWNNNICFVEVQGMRISNHNGKLQALTDFFASIIGQNQGLQHGGLMRQLSSMTASVQHKKLLQSSRIKKHCSGVR
jgi:hypothetical protein